MLKKNDYDINVKIDGMKLVPSHSLKYLGICIDKHLDWSVHTDVGMLSKI